MNFAFLPLAEGPPAGVTEWLAALGWLLGIVVVIMKVFVRKPSIEAEFVTKRELEETRKEMSRQTHDVKRQYESLSSKFDRDKHEIMAAGEERAKALHERINELVNSTNDQMRDLPGNVIALLKNTGHLR